MHGLVTARLGDTKMALRFFRQTAAIDLANTHAATDGGVHIAALGGIWMLAVFGFGGVSFRNDELTIDPRLPPSWRSLTFRVQWRRRSLRISIDSGKQTVEAIVEAGEPIVLFVGGEPNQISSDATLVIPIRSPQER